jgi:hypothetical protein
MTDEEDRALSYRLAMVEKSIERLEKKFEDLRSTFMNLIITILTATFVLFATFLLSQLR